MTSNDSGAVNSEGDPKQKTCSCHVQMHLSMPVIHMDLFYQLITRFLGKTAPFTNIIAGFFQPPGYGGLLRRVTGQRQQETLENSQVHCRAKETNTKG